MKILQLVTKRQYRGAEVFAANLSEELIDLGHEIIFAGLYKNDKDVLTVENAKNIDLTNDKNGAFSVHLLHKIINLIRSTKPDVVQCNGSDTLKYMVAASFFVPEIPIIYRNISMISEWIGNTQKKLLYKKLLKRVVHVSSVGDEAIADFIKTFNYPEEQTSVIRRGIPIIEVDPHKARQNLENQFGFNPADKIIIHIGNFSPEKNHVFLLDIFSELKDEHPEIKLVLVGNGVLFQTVQDEVNKRGLEKTIFLTGFRKDIPELLAASDLFVLCSKVEGVPGVILEAGMQKIPAIATNVGGVLEVLKNNETGYIIDNFDEQEFKNKIIELSVNDTSRKKMGENAHSLVLKEFNPVKNARKFEKLYENLSGVKKGKDNLRILQIIQKKQYRGAEIFCCQLSNELIKFGHEVEILSIYEGDAKLPFRKKINSLSRSKSNRFLDIQGWRKLAKIVNKFKPDVIQANAADTLKYTVFSKIVFGWHTPVVFRNASASSYYIKNSLSHKINSYLLKKIDLIISVSQASKTDLNSTFPTTSSKSIVIPIGTNSPIETIAGPSTSKIYDVKDKNILHVGSFTSEKNHLGLLRIFEKVKESVTQAKLHLIGTGPLRINIENNVKKMRLTNSVLFYGGINNPQNFIKNADVLVLPSKIEGLPGVLLEAMAYKTPVIAYDVGGVSEIVNELSGELIESGNETLFANKVIEILKQNNLSQIEYAYKMVTENFQNNNIAQDFVSSYNKLRESKDGLSKLPEKH